MVLRARRAPRTGPAQAGYWRSAAARAWGLASGAAGGLPGPVHLNLALREPLVPDAGRRRGGSTGRAAAGRPGAAAPWTRFGAGRRAWLGRARAGRLRRRRLRPGPLLELAEQARLAGAGRAVVERQARAGALSAYQYLLGDAGFMAGAPARRDRLGRPARAVPRPARAAARAGDARHVVIAQGPGRWSDPARTATDVAVRVAAAGRPAGPACWLAGPDPADGWLDAWLRATGGAAPPSMPCCDADGRAQRAPAGQGPGRALPDGALLWAASSLPIRDLDQHLAPRAGLRILASRGASGIDGLVSSAIGAALAHQAAGGGPAVALLGDLALLHDAPGLFIGPGRAAPRPVPDRGQQRRRRNLLDAGAGRVPWPVRAGLRHAARGRTCGSWPRPPACRYRQNQGGRRPAPRSRWPTGLTLAELQHRRARARPLCERRWPGGRRLR